MTPPWTTPACRIWRSRIAASQANRCGSRVSFTGDRSYEISIRAHRADALWARLRREGEAFDAVRIGLEALMVLRAEKGYIGISRDADGNTMPHDLGIDAPRQKRTSEFVGRRSLFTEDAMRGDRKQFVGLTVARGVSRRSLPARAASS